MSSTQLLSTIEVSRFLGLTVPTVLGYVRDGSLRASLLGGKFRYTRENLDEFIASNVRTKRDR
jgi:excisionase family DNA binding protein